MWSTEDFKDFKDFSIISEAEVDVLLEFPCFFYDLTDVGNLIPAPSAFSQSSLYFQKFSIHELLKPNLKGFKHSFASMWNELDGVVVWTLLDIAFLWD